MVVTVRRDRAMADTMPRRSPPTRVMSEAAIATSAPVPIAMPRSAWARAGRVVDAVADHRDDVPLVLQRDDVLGLLRRQHLGEHVLDADLAGDGGGGGGVVAGEHPHLQPEGLQLGDRLGGLGLERVGDQEQAGRCPVDRDEQRGGAVLRAGGGRARRAQ